MKPTYIIIEGVECEKTRGYIYYYDHYHRNWESQINEYVYFNNEGAPISQCHYEQHLNLTKNLEKLKKELN